MTSFTNKFDGRNINAASGLGNNIIPNNDDLDPLLPTSHPRSFELEFEKEANTKSKNTTTSLCSSCSSETASSTAANTTTTNTYTKWQVISYTLIFFFMMIAHEVALEAASTSFHQLDSLASAVTLFQFGFCFFLPLCTSTKEVMRTFPKSWKAAMPYVQLSVLVFGATGLATQSLKYVSYPTKVVFKSAKLIPTMLLSTILTTTTSRSKRPKYSYLDYFAALLLCLGAAGYSFNSSRSSGIGTDEEKRTSMYGIALLIISIICDALLPNLQQNLMTNHNQDQLLLLPSMYNNGENKSSQEKESSSSSNKKDYDISFVPGLSAQAVMVNTNAVGFGSILVYMLISGSLMDAVSTSLVEPKLFFYLFCVGVGLSVSVLAYTKLIHASGSVVAVAVSTLRKVVTVLLSYILFPKPILPIHIFSGLLVLMGVLIGTFCRKTTK